MAGSWRTRREVREQPFAVYDETGLQALLDSFEKRMKRLNDQYLRMMGEHIRDIGTLWPSDVHRLQQIRRMNRNLRDLERRIADVAGQSEAEIERVFEQVAAADVRMATKILGVQDIGRVMDNPALQRILRAQARETAKGMKNLSNTTVVSKYYRNAIDEGVSAVQSGVEDYNSAIRRVIREAGQSGLRVTDKGTRVVDYESGYARRLDTAARMNILDGVRHLNQSVMEEVAHQFGANGVEIDAHMLCAEDHLPYQGQQFSNDDFERIQDSLPRPFGEWNCRHTLHGIILGVSPPTYTPEQLAEMHKFSTESVTFDGRTKTRYQWSQEMRRCEVAIRQKKDLATLAKASGDESLRRKCQGAIVELNRYYGELAGKAGVKPEYQRTYVQGFRDVKIQQKTVSASKLQQKTATGLTGNRNSGTISLETEHPPLKSMSNEDVRKWYLAEDAKIPDLIDRSRSLEEQARQACELRNKNRTMARDLMADQETRKRLDLEAPNKSFEELLADKIARKHLTREEAIADILKTATKTNQEVNKKFGLEGES